MTIFRMLRIAAAASALALTGGAANAMTVAEVTANGGFALGETGGDEVLVVDGAFTAFLDPAFDSSATNDFLFELDLQGTGVPTIDEELFVPGITGDDIIAFGLGLVADIDAAFPGLTGNVVAEVIDGDLNQSEILNDIWFGFDFAFALDAGTPGLGIGTFAILFSEVEIDPLFPNGFTPSVEGSFDLSASISTVVAPVPLPAAFPLLVFGVGCLFVVGRRKKA